MNAEEAHTVYGWEDVTASNGLLMRDSMDLDFLKWTGHAGFILEAEGKTIYIDPFRLKRVEKKADILLITHPHFDHLSADDIAKVATKDTQVLVPSDSTSKIGHGKVTGVAPNGKYNVLGIEVSTVPAYNIVAERLDKHPKANGWVGYIVSANGAKVYHAGDTDFIPEMKPLDVDLALLPIGGTYTMNLDEAIAAANSMRSAKRFSPIHYKNLLGAEGSKRAEDEFSKRVKNSVILGEVHEPSFSF